MLAHDNVDLKLSSVILAYIQPQYKAEELWVGIPPVPRHYHLDILEQGDQNL